MIARASLFSVLHRFSLVCFALVGLAACSPEVEQSMTFYDEFLEQQVVSKLESENVPFRRDGMTIWYSIDDREIVARIFENEVARRPAQYAFLEKEKQQQFLSLLIDQGVLATAKPQDEPPYVVFVPKENHDQAEAAFQVVLKGNGPCGP